MGTQLPLPQRGPSPNFRLISVMSKTAGCIKMPFVVELGLGPGDIVLDRDPAQPPKSGVSTPNFGSCLLRPNGWMDQDDTWHGGKPQSRPHCVRWGPSSPAQRGTAPQYSARACLLWPNGYVDQDVTWYGAIGFGPGHIVLDGYPAPPKRGTAPQFSADVYYGQRSPI